VHGASWSGVDMAIIKAARALKLPHLGFSCPRYLMYVKDDSDPVYLSMNEHEYSDVYTSVLHSLIAANGRKQAFYMDLKASIDHGKLVIDAPIVQAISPLETVSPMTPDRQIADAIGYFTTLFRSTGVRKRETWDELLERVTGEVVDAMRKKVSPEAAFNLNDELVPA